MGLIFDTCIFIHIERGKKVDFAQWQNRNDVYISSITASELLVGVHMADRQDRRLKRTAFVEAILSEVKILDFTLETSRLHAEIYSSLSENGNLIGAHDLIISATALEHDCAVVTSNHSEFQRVPGLEVIKI